MQDLTAANEVSAQDLQYLINCGQGAGASGCNDLVRHIFFTKVDSCLLLRRRLCSTDYAGNVRWTTVKANSKKEKKNREEPPSEEASAHEL